MPDASLRAGTTLVACQCGARVLDFFTGQDMQQCIHSAMWAAYGLLRLQLQMTTRVLLEHHLLCSCAALGSAGPIAQFTIAVVGQAAAKCKWLEA